MQLGIPHAGAAQKLCLIIISGVYIQMHANPSEELLILLITWTIELIERGRHSIYLGVA